MTPTSSCVNLVLNLSKPRFYHQEMEVMTVFASQGGHIK